MIVNEYKLVDQCVQDGVELGINRAYKYSDGMPNKQALISEIQSAVMQELCEWFRFDDAE